MVTKGVNYNYSAVRKQLLDNVHGALRFIIVLDVGVTDVNW